MMNDLCRQCCLVQLIFLSSVLGLSAQVLLVDHTDITFFYSTDTGEWRSEFRHGGTEENPNNSTPFNEASLPAQDSPAWSGNRFVQPTLSSFDFTGITDGDPLWILPQSDPPTYDYTLPGFRNDQAPGTFRDYDPGDSRVESGAFPWITVSLMEMTYVGTSLNPNFSLWQDQGGPIVWMATSDGIDARDLFYLEENAHDHLNFGFSSLGVYRIAFQPSAILESTGETVEGTPQEVTFTIGTKATWLASHYAGDDLVTDSVSGDESDSDGDGIPLLLEYAFNLDPTEVDFKVLEPATGTDGLPSVRLMPDGGDAALQIEYVRRKTSTNPQITYFAEFKDDLSPGQWTVQASETVTSINDTWERVVVVDAVDTSDVDQRFARVRVEMQSAISY